VTHVTHEIEEMIETAVGAGGDGVGDIDDDPRITGQPDSRVTA